MPCWLDTIRDRESKSNIRYARLVPINNLSDALKQTAGASELFFPTPESGPKSPV
jgi:hypothetical protein